MILPVLLHLCDLLNRFIKSRKTKRIILESKVLEKKIFVKEANCRFPVNIGSFAHSICALASRKRPFAARI